jgi:RNA polymerase sigma factor (sigma-70 family)
MPSQRILPGDAELAARLARDDKDAFSELYNRYWEDAFNAAYSRLKDFEQSRDIVQNVFVSVWDRRGKVEIGNFRSYLLTAIKFQVIKYSTQNPTRAVFLANFSDLLLSGERADDKILQKDILRLLELFLNTLPKKRREIFVLHYKENLSIEEIATRLDISKKTVQNQLLNVNAALRGKLDQLIPLLIILVSGGK